MQIGAKQAVRAPGEGHEGPPSTGTGTFVGLDESRPPFDLVSLGETEVVLAGCPGLRVGTTVKLVLNLPGAGLLVVQGTMAAGAGPGTCRVELDEPPRRTQGMLQHMVRQALTRAAEPGAARPVPPARPGRA
jgi:hypothetical protein